MTTTEIIEAIKAFDIKDLTEDSQSARRPGRKHQSRAGRLQRQNAQAARIQTQPAELNRGDHT